MTPPERLGKRLFVILAALLILEKLAGVWRGMVGGGEIDWPGLILAPSVDTALTVLPELFRHWVIQLALTFAILCLWTGNVWLRLLVGGAYVLFGILTLLRCGRDVIEFEAEASIVNYGLAGFVDLLAGLAFLALPSLQAFFRYQREGPLTSGDDQIIPVRSNQGFPRLLAASGWGLMLGCASGLLVAAHHGQSYAFEFLFIAAIDGISDAVIAIVLGGLGGALVGGVAGLAVGAVQFQSRQPTLRFVLTRGLIAAGVCVTLMMLILAIGAGVSGTRLAPIFGPPEAGWGTALFVAMLALLQFGPQVGLFAFVIGSAVGLLVQDS